MIIVTGANGFIGSAIVWELNQKGVDDIVCVDSVSREERPQTLANRKFSKFLLKDQIWDYLQQPHVKENLSWIIHMGACSSTTETNWEFLYENNTFYTQRLFEWCTKNGKNFIYASSAATYGAGELGYDDHTDPEQLKPLNLYGKSKLIFDQWALRQTKTPLHWYGLKFFNVYGPNEYHKKDMASVVFKAFNQIQSSGELKLFKSYNSSYKDGEQLRDFVYVKDITRWIWELMYKAPKNGIYNNGFGTPRSWLDLANATFKNIPRPLKIDWIEMPENIRGQYQYYTKAEMQKWSQENLSAPQWSLEKGIEDYVCNYLKPGILHL